MTKEVPSDAGHAGDARVAEGAAPRAPHRAPDQGEFRFGRAGGVNVFYWVENRFGYAIVGDADRATLLKVSEEIWRQLASA